MNIDEVKINVKRNRKSVMKNLLNGDYESFYWIGFLLADGAFYKNGRIRLVLSMKDIDHLQKYARFIESDVKVYTSQDYDYAYVASMDKLYVGELMETFDIHPNKTYNPPNVGVFKKLSFEQFMSVVCGFIDGDGCIKYQTNRPDSAIMIKLHHSWKDFLQYILDFINTNFNKIKSKIGITKCQKYVYITLTDNTVINNIKDFAISYKLPIMMRKWNNIIHYDTRTVKAINKKTAILQYITNNPNISIKNIALATQLPYSTVYSILTRLDRR